MLIKRSIVGFAVGVCLLLTPCTAVAEEPDPGEIKIWVPVPVTPADGRSYTIEKPGELPNYVRPNWGGGYTVQQLGELPISVKPDWGGGYKIQPVGELPTYVRPTYGGGYKIETGPFPGWADVPEW